MRTRRAAPCCREVRAAIVFYRYMGAPPDLLAVAVRTAWRIERRRRLGRRIVRAWTNAGSWRGPLRNARIS